AHRLERVGVGEGAVVGGAQLLHPVGVPVGGGGAEPDRLPFGQLGVDLGQLGVEVGAGLEQLAVVLDRVQADLVAGGADVVEEAGFDRIPVADEVPGGVEAVALLDLDDLADQGDALRALDVVGEDRGEAVVVRPGGDRRQRLGAARPQFVAERGAAGLDQDRLDRPAGELGARLAHRVTAPQGELQPPRHQRLDPVVGAHQTRATLAAVAVAFLEQVAIFEFGGHRRTNGRAAAALASPAAGGGLIGGAPAAYGPSGGGAPRATFSAAASWRARSRWRAPATSPREALAAARSACPSASAPRIATAFARP